MTSILCSDRLRKAFVRVSPGSVSRLERFTPGLIDTYGRVGQMPHAEIAPFAIPRFKLTSTFRPQWPLQTLRSNLLNGPTVSAAYHGLPCRHSIC